MLPDYQNKIAEGSDFKIFVEKVAAGLPKSIPIDVLHESLRSLAGERLTKTLLDETCWRLAGNIQRLKCHKLVTPWNNQHTEEWVPVQIRSARRRRGGKGKAGWQFNFQILAGIPCPRVIQKFWSTRFCRYMAKYLGFTFRLPSDRSGLAPERLYQHPTEFVTLRLAVLVTPELSKREPDFEKTDMTPGLLDWNKEQLKHRDRVRKGYVCPRSYTQRVKCYQCPAGYKSCRAGTHRLNWTIDYCSHCGSDKVAFDADLSAEMCINCYESHVMRRT